MPLTLIASLIDPHSLEPLQPSDERCSFFQSITSIEYSPPVTPDIDSAHNIQCPFCVKHKELSTRFWTESGTGWAQPNFKGVCPVSYQKFTKENMGIRKFCDELEGGYSSRTRDVNPSAPPFDPFICSETLLDQYTEVENEADANTYMQSLMKVSPRGPYLTIG